jgi:hypothetical protein
LNSRIQFPVTLLGTMAMCGPRTPRDSRKYASSEIVWSVFPSPLHKTIHSKDVKESRAERDTYKQGKAVVNRTPAGTHSLTFRRREPR